eukprot:3080046-Rhodomonas_salina.1
MGLSQPLSSPNGAMRRFSFSSSSPIASSSFRQLVPALPPPPPPPPPHRSPLLHIIAIISSISVVSMQRAAIRLRKGSLYSLARTHCHWGVLT